MDELLECPFCGEKAVHVVAANPKHARYVMCFRCNNTTAMTDTREQAAALWNCRADAAIRAKLAAAERENERLTSELVSALEAAAPNERALADVMRELDEVVKDAQRWRLLDASCADQEIHSAIQEAAAIIAFRHQVQMIDGPEMSIVELLDAALASSAGRGEGA